MGHRARGGSGGPLSREAEARATGHAGMRAHLAICLDLELVHGGTRSSGYRQWPPGPPREKM
jgi:hypothetical protein